MCNFHLDLHSYLSYYCPLFYLTLETSLLFSSMLNIDKTKTTPGIHRQFRLDRFEEREQKLIKRLANQWYLTSSGFKLRLASSQYDYFLMKPTPMFSELFNIEREVIVVFSPYPKFEPRSLDAFDAAEKDLPNLRVESVCKILISDDREIERKVTDMLKTDPEQPIVIPFTYEELLSNYDDYFLRNRFIAHFYSRDLFAFLSPLKKDLYFFGRSQLLQEIINKHRSGEHTGLFGLRKSGKTSVIYAIERHLSSHNGQFLSIDCESPSIHKLRWYELLEKLVEEYKNKIQSNYIIKKGDRYSEKTAADSFTEDILQIHKLNKLDNLLILFDEIERISPQTASSEHWRNGSDFIYFWQTLRAFYQRNQNVFTYMVVGTNPSCVEKSVIEGHENPLFGSIPSIYLPSFTVDQTREMVRKLGRIMGLTFDPIIFSKLVDDFGGHPFLIRQFCSKIHEMAKGPRPIKIDKALYEKTMKEFQITAIDYLAMIVGVLRDWYPDEYDMLRFLAQNDEETFSHLAKDNANYTKHLIGYGLINRSPHGYSFNIEALREYLVQLHKYERLNLTEDEKVAEISARRNQIEKSLRVLVRNTLRASLGKKKAGEAVLSSIPEKRREAIGTSDIDILLARDKSPLFFLDLVQIIKREWDAFKNIFETEKTKLDIMLEEINFSGRPDAHAKYIDKDDFDQLRLYFKKLESILDDWS